MSDDAYLYVITPRNVGLTAEDYLLRKKGDWHGYVTMMNGGAIESSQFFRLMMNYYARGIESFSNIQPENDGILLAVSVWGEDYLKRFLNLVIPSLLEEKNIAALKQKKATILIHTDTNGRDSICDHESIAQLIKSGIQVQFMLLDEDVIGLISTIPNSKYWHLGMTQSLHLQYAKSLNVDYHIMMSDMVYSAGYFDRLFKLNKPIITHGCISSYEGDIPLERFRKGFSISIEAKELMTLSLKHAHLRANQHFVKSNKKLPRSHLLIFEGKDRVHIMSPHQTIAYMSKDVIAKIPNRFFFTLDSELEKLTSGEPIYTPSYSDDLVVSEVSGMVESYARLECESVGEFCSRFKSRIPEESLYGLFLQPMTFPIDRNLLGDRWYMEEYEIEAMKKEIKTMLCHDIQK